MNSDYLFIAACCRPRRFAVFSRPAKPRTRSRHGDVLLDKLYKKKRTKNRQKLPYLSVDKLRVHNCDVELNAISVRS